VCVDKPLPPSWGLFLHCPIPRYAPFPRFFFSVGFCRSSAASTLHRGTVPSPGAKVILIVFQRLCFFFSSFAFPFFLFHFRAADLAAGQFRGGLGKGRAGLSWRAGRVPVEISIPWCRVRFLSSPARRVFSPFSQETLSGMRPPRNTPRGKRGDGFGFSPPSFGLSFLSQDRPDFPDPKLCALDLKLFPHFKAFPFFSNLFSPFSLHWETAREKIFPGAV